MHAEPLPPGSVIGILGGGQLGRMLALASARLGLSAHVFCPEPDSPAFAVTALSTCAAYDDEAALARFADSVQAITYEFENVPAATAAFLAQRRPVRPGPKALAVAQDRLEEKTFAAALGAKTAPFRKADSAEESAAAFAALGGGPAVLKTRRFGYDGKGQAKVDSADACRAAFVRLGGAPCIVEGFVPFAREISVIAARGVDGAVAAYDAVENVHKNHILHTSSVPGSIPPASAAAAGAIARRLVAALDYAGVLGVEFFEQADGAVLFNEMAPRVHNSGHWTEDACDIGQFELHMRAVAGWPLPQPKRHSDAVMTNLVGDDAADWRALAAEPGAALRLYGKADARPGRKMGHITRLSPRRDGSG